jgi:hypothetical protein
MRLGDGGWSIVRMYNIYSFVENLSTFGRTSDIPGSSPSGLVTRCLDVLRALSSSERDLIRVVVEVVHELRDANDDDEVIVRQPTSPILLSV